MSFTSPRTWVAGEIVTASIMNTHVKDQFRYLKGLDGVPVIESGLTIDNTDGDERLLLPLLSTAECTTVLNAEGEVAFDETTHQMKEYDGTAIRIVISEADVDDTPVNGATTVPVSSNWAYDFINTLTTQADLPYATAAGTWTRLAKGTANQFLRMNAGATAPTWTTAGAIGEIFIPAGAMFSARAFTTFSNFHCIPMIQGDTVRINFKVPADFASLTSCKVIFIPTGTGSYDWTANTEFGAETELYGANTDSDTADTVACTTNTISGTDVSAALTGIAAGDYVGMLLTLDVLTTTTAYNVIGFSFRYA